MIKQNIYDSRFSFQTKGKRVVLACVLLLRYSAVSGQTSNPLIESFFFRARPDSDRKCYPQTRKIVERG